MVRSRWGTTRYVYHHRNPVGLALIVLTLVFAGVVLYGMSSSSRWSDDALGGAVRKAATALKSSALPGADEDEWLIRDAVENADGKPAGRGSFVSA
ncbi:hypothetical protein [Streptomyces halobius]|uniref:Uncharacterized protein n=1 Tax=Streptomyces halobius TaxID=2879846 RepID=A0ABY4MCA4_9ACTN|nr:hypothetical protein [Streptomyces halobius]UQA94030.1 hypothetical protein K9S39_21065 [Streptomyces halobius]